MLKQKRESYMLNNIINSYILNNFSVAKKVIIFILVTLLFSACSTTPEDSANNTGTPGSISNETYVKAIAAMKSGNTKKAQALLQKTITQQPDFSKAHLNLGIIFIKKNLLDDAEKSLQLAIKFEPNNIYAFNQLGFLYRTKGEFSKAKESYEKAIDINSDYAYAHLNLGILYDLYLYDIENAITQYKIYLTLSKKDKKVAKWIFDLERRHKKSLSKK